MRWIVSTLIVLFMAWCLFMASPFLALYRLAEAVEARDVAGVQERVSMPELRLDLTRQLVSEYLKSVDKGRALSGLDRQLASHAGATLADPLVAQLATPEALIDLFDDGWPQQVASPEGAPPIPMTFNLRSFGRAWRLFVTSETRGFRKIYIALPHSRPPQERFRLQMRLADSRWRLASVDLPETLLQNLVKKLPRGAAAAAQ
jgi:hypothetical protein